MYLGGGVGHAVGDVTNQTHQIRLQRYHPLHSRCHITKETHRVAKEIGGAKDLDGLSFQNLHGDETRNRDEAESGHRYEHEVGHQVWV